MEIELTVNPDPAKNQSIEIIDYTHVKEPSESEKSKSFMKLC